MGLFNFFNQKPVHFLSKSDEQHIVKAVAQAEKRTSGEIRVFIENRCRYVDALDRAAELFFNLQMDKTDLRNAVLVYIAIKDKQMAVFGDEGIHQKVGTAFWNEQVQKMFSCFNVDNIAQGIIDVVNAIGEALYTHFPYDEKTDKNELPDDIIFGK